MKRIVLFALAVVSLSGLAFAQYAPNGYIGLFSDQNATSCSLDQPGAGLIDVYVFIMDNTGGATGIFYKIEASAGFNGVYLYHVELGPWPSVIGVDSSGVSIGLDQCYISGTGGLAVMQVGYLMSGASDPCASLTIVEHPDVFMKGIVDCSDPYPLERPTPGSTLYLNPDGSCDCGPEPAPAEPSTWGRIKALYE